MQGQNFKVLSKALSLIITYHYSKGGKSSYHKTLRLLPKRIFQSMELNQCRIQITIANYVSLSSKYVVVVLRSLIFFAIFQIRNPTRKSHLDPIRYVMASAKL